MIIYLTSFMLIEHWNRLHYTVIHNAADDLIPFVPVFVIPYLLWFPYILGSVLFLLMVHEDTYRRVCTSLIIGMTAFIAVSIVFPNIHLMRPEVMPAENIFTKMVGLLYLADTPTNLTPSIHVFNSLCVMAGIWDWTWKTDKGKILPAQVRRFSRFFLTILGLLIILSTMLIKQHSSSDVVIAFAFYLITHLCVYRLGFVFGYPQRRSRGWTSVPVQRSRVQA
jgi:membrane-associated phospholipid phosphatase